MGSNQQLDLTPPSVTVPALGPLGSAQRWDHGLTWAGPQGHVPSDRAASRRGHRRCRSTAKPLDVARTLLRWATSAGSKATAVETRGYQDPDSARSEGGRTVDRATNGLVVAPNSRGCAGLRDSPEQAG